MKTKGIVLVLSCVLVTSLFFLFVGEPSSTISKTLTSSFGSTSSLSSSPSSNDERVVALPLDRSLSLKSSLLTTFASSSLTQRRSDDKRTAKKQEPHFTSYYNRFRPNEVPRHDEADGEKINDDDWIVRDNNQQQQHQQNHLGQDVASSSSSSSIREDQQEVDFVFEQDSDDELSPEVYDALELLGFRGNRKKQSSSSSLLPSSSSSSSVLRSTSDNDGSSPNIRKFVNINNLNASLPIFVTAITSNEFDEDSFSSFITRFHNSFANFVLVVYTVSFDDRQLDSVNKSCNVSTNCLVRRLDVDRFPSHISDEKLKSFRPIVIQHLLNEVGAVVWINHDLYFHGDNSKGSPSQLLLGAFDDATHHEGILSWTIEQPTSALTHPKMFDYFNRQQSDFYFHRMIDPSSCLILINTKRIHRNVMLPWIKCALTIDCISPIGAQSTGCRFDKKPMYRYSGCHFYDISALNVILGSLYEFRETSYADNDKKFLFFSKNPPEQVEMTSSQSPTMILADSSDVPNIDNNNKSSTIRALNGGDSDTSQNNVIEDGDFNNNNSKRKSPSSSLLVKQPPQQSNNRPVRDVSLKYSFMSSSSSSSSRSWKNRRRRR